MGRRMACLELQQREPGTYYGVGGGRQRTTGDRRQMRDAGWCCSGARCGSALSACTYGSRRQAGWVKQTEQAEQASQQASKHRRRPRSQSLQSGKRPASGACRACADNRFAVWPGDKLTSLQTRPCQARHSWVVMRAKPSHWS